MVDLISCKLVLQTKHLTIKSALFPAFLSFRTSVCLLTCNISLSWVVLTLALALKGWLWVSLSRWDMPVCFGLYSATLSVDSISSRHPCKRTDLDVFQCISTFPQLLSHQRRSHDSKIKPLCRIGASQLLDLILHRVNFSLIDVVFLQVPVCSTFAT